MLLHFTLRREKFENYFIVLPPYAFTGKFKIGKFLQKNTRIFNILHSVKYLLFVYIEIRGRIDIVIVFKRFEMQMRAFVIFSAHNVRSP